MKIKKHRVIVGAAAVFAGALYLAAPKPSHNELKYQHLGRATVMITNPSKTSGGTGSILKSFPDHSKILTNKHVCEVVEHGGLVITDDHVDHPVIAFARFPSHDLCLIEVAEDLHVNTPIASHAPYRYSVATVAGHPNLYPTIFTEGHFSDKKSILINAGFKACEEDDFKNPDTAFFCLVAHVVPVIKQFESIVVSATIMPGSSGSAVYNEDGELSAVIFAGKDDLGYGFAVPYEYVLTFLDALSRGLIAPEFPKVEDARRAPASSKSTEIDEDLAEQQFEKACENASTQKQKEMCKIVLEDTIYVYRMRSME